MAILIPNGKQSYIDSAGNPLVGGKLYTYAVGTNTPLVTFADAGEVAQNSNPVTLDSRGEATIFWKGVYKVRLEDALGNTIWTVDGVNGLDAASSVLPLFAAAGGAALIGTTTGKTVQQELNAPSSLAASGGAALVVHKYAGAGAVNRTIAQIINDLGLSVKGYNAKGDGATNDYPAFLNTLAQCVTSGAPMFLPPGNYVWDLNGIGSAIWDVTRLVNGARRSIPIIGAGIGVTSINIINATSGLALQSSTDWFDPVMKGFRIYGSIAGPMLTLGKDDYSDPINMFDLQNLSIENSRNDPSAEGIRLNYIAGGTGRNVRAVCYSNGIGTNVGTALRCRQAEFVDFIGGSFGNAHYSVRITDGFNFNLTFDGQTFENCDVALRHDSANSGGHAIIAPQLTNVTQFGVQSTAMLADKRMVIEPFNFAALGGFPATLIDPANMVGVIVRDRQGITTPGIPASGSSLTNTTGRALSVTIWGGTVTSDILDGFGIGITNANPRTYIVASGGTIGMNYTVAPTWLWKNLQA